MKGFRYWYWVRMPREALGRQVQARRLLAQAASRAGTATVDKHISDIVGLRIRSLCPNGESAFDILSFGMYYGGCRFMHYRSSIYSATMAQVCRALRLRSRNRPVACALVRQNGFIRAASSIATTAPLDLNTMREKVRKGDFEAYICGNLMPSSARQSFFTMRTLNIELASVRENARGNAAMGHLRMGFWRDVVDKASSGGHSSHPLFPALKAAFSSHRHTKRWLDRLIDARDDDLDGRPPSTIADVEAYGDATAGSLLYLSLEACGVRHEHADSAASHIGKALGIATLLRALPVHARMGQRYIPTDVMSKHGLTEEELFIQPEEVTTSDGIPILQQADANQAAASIKATGASAHHGHSHAPGQQCNHDHSGGGGGSKRSYTTSAAAWQSGANNSSGKAHQVKQQPEDEDRSVRLTMSPAARRLAEIEKQKGAWHPGMIKSGAGTAAKPAAAAPSPPPRRELEETPAHAAASAALKSGLGASSLILHKSPETVAKIKGAVFDLACQALAHIEHARDLAPRVPHQAVPALLPAVPVHRFLRRLEHQQYDVFAAGGLGPWQDGRPYARLLLQLDLLKHTVRNTY